MTSDNIKVPNDEPESDAPNIKKQKLDTNALVETAPKKNLDSSQGSVANEAIEDIEAIEDKINSLEDEQSIEICKLEQKYVQKKNPLYSKRAECISKIPKFWSTAFLQHPMLSSLIVDDDETAFSYLKAIKIDQVSRDEKVEDAETGNSYIKTLNHSISFEFETNPYFSNSILSKSYFQVMEEIVSEGSEIDWKPNMNLIKNSRNKANNVNGEKSDDKNHQAGDMNPINEEVESFFAWFNEHDDAANDGLGDVIKDDLYMHALNYYLDENHAGDDEEDEYEEEYEEEDEEVDPNVEIDLKDSE